MKIRVVRLGAVKNPSRGAAPELLELTADATARDALRVALNADFTRENDYTLMLDAKTVPPDQVLQEGDTLFILRTLGGG